jgi:hypothetical protein
VLIENSDAASQWAVGQVLAGAGFDVAMCDGPERLPKGRCSLVTHGSCALAENADVILNSLSPRREQNRAVLAALRASVPTTPIILEINRADARHHQAQLEACRLLTTPASSEGILGAVESAIRERDQSLASTNEGEA